MQVPFPSGEVFSGPWTDDEYLEDNQPAYRRLIPAWVTRKGDGRLRVNSGAFPPHRVSLSVSVTLGQVAKELGIDGQHLALSGHSTTHGVGVFNVGEARDLGFLVRRVPVRDDPAHGMLFVQNPNTGVVPDKGRCRSLGRKLARQAYVLVEPPNMPDGTIM